MEFFDSRKDDLKAAKLCARALAGFLAAADRSIAQGEVSFMIEDIERYRGVVRKIHRSAPGAEAMRQKANKAPEPTPGSVTPRAIEGESK